jgi:hypothetical protein
MYGFGFVISQRKYYCVSNASIDCWLAQLEIFMVRTWAVWERSKAVGLFLFIQSFTTSVVGLYCNGIYGNSLTCKSMRLELACCVICSSLSGLQSWWLFRFNFKQTRYPRILSVSIESTQYVRLSSSSLRLT